MQLPKQTEFGLKTTINRGHTLGPLKNTHPCDPTRKMQLPRQTEFGLKTTINPGHTLGPLKNTYPCDPIRKMQLPKQTEFGLREVSFFTGRGAPENWGIRYFFLDQKGDQKIFQIKKGDHLYFLKK